MPDALSLMKLAPYIEAIRIYNIGLSCDYGPEVMYCRYDLLVPNHQIILIRENQVQGLT